MRKRIFLPLILGGVFLLAGCSYGNKNTNAPSGDQTAPSGQAQSQAETVGNIVVIKNFSFIPNSLTIKAGTTVTWTNQDIATHTIKSNSFNSGNLATDDKFQFTFTNPGTYSYSCGIHPSMQGTIVVQ